MSVTNDDFVHPPTQPTDLARDLSIEYERQVSSAYIFLGPGSDLSALARVLQNATRRWREKYYSKYHRHKEEEEGGRLPAVAHQIRLQCRYNHGLDWTSPAANDFFDALLSSSSCDGVYCCHMLTIDDFADFPLAQLERNLHFHQAQKQQQQQAAAATITSRRFMPYMELHPHVTYNRQNLTCSAGDEKTTTTTSSSLVADPAWSVKVALDIGSDWLGLKALLGQTSFGKKQWKHLTVFLGNDLGHLMDTTRKRVKRRTRRLIKTKQTSQDKNHLQDCLQALGRIQTTQLSLYSQASGNVDFAILLIQSLQSNYLLQRLQMDIHVLDGEEAKQRSRSTNIHKVFPSNEENLWKIFSAMEETTTESCSSPSKQQRLYQMDILVFDERAQTSTKERILQKLERVMKTNTRLTNFSFKDARWKNDMCPPLSPTIRMGLALNAGHKRRQKIVTSTTTTADTSTRQSIECLIACQRDTAAFLGVSKNNTFFGDNHQPEGLEAQQEQAKLHISCLYYFLRRNPTFYASLFLVPSLLSTSSSGSSSSSSCRSANTGVSSSSVLQERKRKR